VTSAAAVLPVAQVGENVGGELEEAPAVTSAAQTGLGVDESGRMILGRESSIEYRDEHGNILDPEQVEAMRDQITFETRYETRTRVVDLANGGNVIEEHVVGASGAAAAGGAQVPVQQVPVQQEEKSYAGTLAEGENPETSAVESVVGQMPASAPVGDDLQKEVSAEAADAMSTGEAQPGAQEV